MGLELLPLFLPVFLYAETHYKFRYFFSWLRKKEPEIVVDAPRFVEPGKPVPVLVLVKDAHRYPVTLQRITVKIRQGEETFLSSDVLTGEMHISERLWWKVFHVSVAGQRGWVELEPLIEYQCGSSTRRCGVDNYKGSSRLPLNTYLAEEPLPSHPSLHFGDCHTHSSYTEDQVEFGAPLKASIELSKAIGLSFFCATDHSYDLDDSPENFLANDPDAPKWEAFQTEVDEINQENKEGFVVVRGEEISCRNASEGNVHLLLLGDRQFFKGSGDSAEKWFKTRSENTIADILRAKSRGSIAVAAHPREPVPRLQELLLGRSEWAAVDLESDGLDGIQFINGRVSRSFEWGVQEWVSLLAKGKRIVGFAGTDAHGNFNRFRQQGIPFLTIEEHHFQLFGQIRTGVVLDGGLSEQSVLKALKMGGSILTDGPICLLKASNEVADVARLGQAISGDKIRLELDARSSIDFGEIESIDILQGTIGGSGEVSVLQELNLNKIDLNLGLSIVCDRPGYVRAVIRTSARNPFSGHSHFCMTNPIWIEPLRRHS
jgi:hypothetical protein